MDDRALVELFLQRDETAPEKAAEAYRNACIGVAMNILHDKEDAEECVNDVWLTAWERIPPEEPTYFGAWLCRVARNLALKRLEHKQAQKRTAEVLPLDELAESLRGVGEDFTEDARLRQLINDFLRSLTAENRKMFLRRYWFGDSVKEIAERFGCTESRVKSSLFRTRNAMRNYLEQEGEFV
ncbi:MAG: sigma-70 family RNA polymerase sigma factor [Clostridia bacterium]|nr:sigma-70 family RNA polymerase sigma factor [Clostridia bacterium]